MVVWTARQLTTPSEGNVVKRTTGKRWLLLGCLLLLTGCRDGGGVIELNGGAENSGKFPKLSPPVSGKADENGLVTQIRPQVARVGDDPLQIVLHWAGKNGPLTHKTPVSVSWPLTYDTLTFHVTSPDGKKHVLKPEPQGKTGGYAGELSSLPTLLLTLTRQGVSVRTPPHEAGWKGGPVAALETAGTYKISVSGELMPKEAGKGQPIPFTSGAVSVERGVEGYVPLDEVVKAARNKLGSKLDANREAREVVYDDADGNRMVHLTGPSKKQWHFVIYTVQVSPEGKVLNAFSKETSSCLAEGTRLDAEAGPLAVERARAGDRLWGYDLERGRRVLTTVRSVRRSEAGQTLRLGCGLRLTGDHPVYASGRWMPAKTLSETDELLRADGTRAAVGKIERVSGVVAVYDVTVDGPHNFFADGVLVHNKDRPYRPDLDDLWYRLWSPEGIDK
jgi:hypothetical protein